MWEHTRFHFLYSILHGLLLMFTEEDSQVSTPDVHRVGLSQVSTSPYVHRGGLNQVSTSPYVHRGGHS